MTDSLAVLDAAFSHMSTARAIEERLRSAYTQGRLRGRLLSGRGQEAIPAGATLALDVADVVAPVHRDLAAHLVRGTTPLTIFRHYLGRSTSISAGREGDLHMGEWSRGVFPMVSHLPDSWPVLAGCALAFKLRGEPRVALAFCGDGATSTGTWHESVNFSAVLDLPIVLVVENNQYAYSTPTSSQYRCERIVERAAGYGIPGELVDGNDVLAVHEVTARAVARARSGGGPTLIEATTMRMEGHAFHDDARYVPDELRDRWAALDPIDACARQLVEHGRGEAGLGARRDQIRADVKAAWAQAEAEPLPVPGGEESAVYAG